MKSVEMLVPLQDVIYLMQVIDYCEQSTVDKLITLVEKDLRSAAKNTENLKALQYFMLHASNSDISSLNNVNVFRRTLEFMKLLSSKDKIQLNLLGSILEHSLSCFNLEEKVNNMGYGICFIESELGMIKNGILSSMEDSAPLARALLVLEKFCTQICDKKLEFVIPESLILEIINCCFDLPLEVSRSFFSSVFPKLILSHMSSDLLHLIWEKIVQSANTDLQLEISLFYLCVLADYFVSLNKSLCSYPLYEHPVFWEILQSGLISENNLSRKQSLYLLKRYISLFDCCDIQIYTLVFFWCPSKRSELMLFWNQIFLFLEVLEEKQTHIIMPAFKNIQDLYLLCKTSVKSCFSWLFCVFYHIINHSSNTLVKWGLSEFCSLNADILFCDKKFDLLLKSFFKALNNMFLYNTDESATTDNLNRKLVDWFTSISMCDNSSYYFKKILNIFVCSSWSPVPLFFLINALSNVPESHQLDSDCYRLLQKILLETLKTQCIFIRSAIQCQLLKCITNLSHTSIETSTALCLLGCFNGEESLSRSSGMWANCVKWLKKELKVENGLEFISLCKQRLFSEETPTISILSFSRGLLFLSDAELLLPKDLSNLMLYAIEPLIDCEKRIYSCPEKQNNCAEFIKCVIDELNNSHNVDFSNDVSKLINHYGYTFMKFIEIRLKRGPYDSFKQVKLYKEFFSSLMSSLFCKEVFTLSAQCPLLDEFISIYNNAFSLLRTNNLPFFQEYLSLNIIFLGYNCFVENYNKHPFSKDITELIIEKYFHGKLVNVCENIDSEPNMKGKLLSDAKKTIWNIFNTGLIYHKTTLQDIFEMFSASELLKHGLTSICEDGNPALVPLLKSFVILLPHNECINSGIKFISKSWEACFELRKSELFWLTISEWIKMAYQEKVMAIESYQQILSNKAKEIFKYGEELVGFVDIFMDQLNTFCLSPEFTCIISDGLTFGAITKKDRRVEDEVCHYIMKKVKNGSMDSFGKGKRLLKNDKEVRLKALKLLLNDKSLNRNRKINCVIHELLSFDESLSKSNNRYFNDSIMHRRKHRICQALLVLLMFIFKNPSSEFEELPEKLFAWALKSLQTNQQPSVRYQLEWMIILICFHQPLFFSSFWDSFEQIGLERIGALCSMISIAYHLAVVANNKDFTEKAIINIIQLSMVHHFQVHLYSQVCLNKLWDLNPEISDRFDIIRKNKWKSLEQGNLLSNSNKLHSHFYFCVFHPLNHFSLQTIYWDLPRLSNISSEEWIHPDILRMKKYSSLNAVNMSLGDAQSLELCTFPTWISVPTGNVEEGSIGNSIQKKIVVWKGIFEEADEISQRATSDIVVVASLIDKAANLGGLARTCEIFAAKELVVPSVAIVKDKEFLGLSMTAEKHLLISEVKPYDLLEYLQTMKKMGYSLVGAEQATGSISLNTAQFPKNCLLLLGSEREGIPANLIPLLDMCVEIPQFGLLRSLNVHVSGALFLWEYSKQHTFSELKKNSALR